MPTASLLLLPIKRLLSLIPSLLGLLQPPAPPAHGEPALSLSKRPAQSPRRSESNHIPASPAGTQRHSPHPAPAATPSTPRPERLVLFPTPLALPPFVPRLPTFALRPLAYLPTPFNALRRPAAKQPASCPLALWQRVGACPGRDPGVRIFRSRRHPAAPSHRATASAPQTPAKSTPRRLKSFLEKTLTARETPFCRPPTTPQPVRRIRGCTSATDTQTRGIAIPGPGRITVTTGARCPPEYVSIGTTLWAYARFAS